MPTPDPHNLGRFLSAQQSTYTQARSELAAGQKRSHWMWFIFPQIQGLGSSSMAQQYAIADLAEAQAYLAHPTLGPRLRECTALVNAAAPKPVSDIFGYPDDLKFHSSVTLFAHAAAGSPEASEANVFAQALDLHFRGGRDAATLNRLNR